MRAFFNVVVLLILCYTKCVGQESDTIKYSMNARYFKNKLHIAWVPPNYNCWKTGNVKGYQLYRAKWENQAYEDFQKVGSLEIDTISIQNSGLSENLKNATLAVLSVNPAPIEFQSNYDALNLYNSSQANSSNFFTAMILTKHSFDLTRLMCLGFLDESEIERGKTYHYFLYYLDQNVMNPNVENLATFTVKAEDYILSERDTIRDLKAFGFDGRMHLSWKPDDLNPYVAYRVQRGYSQAHMYVVNTEVPILDFRQDETDPIGFLDSGLIMNTPYLYQIVGFDQFGIEGPPSDIIEAVSNPAPISVYPSFDSIAIIPDYKYVLHWSFQENQINKIDNFKLFRSVNNDQNWQEIATIPANGPHYSFEDFSPPKTAFYKVIAFQKYTHNALPSIERLVQMPDTIKPEPPMIIEAIGKKENRIVLNWHPPHDDDVDGYKVYLANSIDGNYLEMTSSISKDSIYQFPYNMNTLREKVYLKVRAVDYHDNYSSLSVAKEVLIPDIVAPAAPVLVNAIQSYTGVTISYYPSASEDVNNHKLMRRKNGEMNWVLIGQMDSISTLKDDSTYVFIDSTITAEAKYSYRLWAYDEMNNGASSLPISLNAIPNPIRNVHMELKYGQVKDTINGVEKSILFVGIINSGAVPAGYQIYRSINGGPLLDHDFITHDEGLLITPNYFSNANFATYRDIIAQPVGALNPSSGLGVPGSTMPGNTFSAPITHVNLKYYLRIVYPNGIVSQLSEPIYININF